LRERVYRIRKAANFNTPMILAPTYAEDGLISQHVCGFMGEPRFEKAYAAGAKGADLAAVGGSVSVRTKPAGRQSMP
jgi:hypothetical protein